MRKLLNWLFPDYSNFGTTKITDKMIEKDFDSLYRYHRASGYSPEESANIAIISVTRKITRVGVSWAKNLHDNLRR